MPLRLPVRGGGPPAAPPPYGGLGQDGWARGHTFLELVETAGTARHDLEAAFAATTVDATLQMFFATYPRRVRVLALCDLDTVDTRVNVAQAERLFTCGRTLWLRAFDAAADLRQLFASDELPLLVFFGEDQREFARWGPRPQALADVERAQPLADAAAREARRRDFYAHSRGADLARELQALLTAHVGGGGALPAPEPA